MDNIVIAGAGGFGREVWFFATELFRSGLGPAIDGFVDDDPDALRGNDFDARLIGPMSDTGAMAGNVVIALGDPVLRRRVRQIVDAAGGRLHTVIHPRAWVAPDAVLGAGCVIAPGAYVGAGARLEGNTAVNVLTSIGHDAVIGSDCVVSPHCAISGNVSFGDQVLCGTNVAVTPGVSVGTNARLAAGATVTRDVPDFALASGNPAKSRVLFRG